MKYLPQLLTNHSKVWDVQHRCKQHHAVKPTDKPEKLMSQKKIELFFMSWTVFLEVGRVVNVVMLLLLLCQKAYGFAYTSDG